MGSRRQARILAFQTIYGWEYTRQDTAELLSFPWIDEKGKENYPEEVTVFARLLIEGFLENRTEVDEMIKQNVKKWDIQRLGKVDLALLRLGCYSLLYQNGIPPSVTIDEAVEMAKIFGGDDSYRFVNGVLDGIRKSIEQR